MVENNEQIIIETRGKFQPFEVVSGQTFEDGKTYNITVKGLCEFAVSKERPEVGILTDKIVYKKTEALLWIKTK